MKEEAIKRLYELEGWYSNDEDDKGGETYRGISRRHHPHLLLWTYDFGTPEADREVQLFYELWFDNCKAREVKYRPLCFEYFFASVNCGQKTAVKFLQTALNFLNRNQQDYPDLVVDGNFGMKTISAIRVLELKTRLGLLRKSFNVVLGSHYHSLYLADPTQEKWIGWMDRVWSEG